MSDAIGKAFLDFFGNPYIATFLIAMLPIVELRGAIPFGYLYVAEVSSVSMGWFGAFSMGFLGSSIIVPLILLLFIPLLNWLKKTRVFRRPATWAETKFQKKAEKLKAKAIMQAYQKLGLPQPTADGEPDGMSEEQKAEITRQVDKKILWGKLIGLFTFVAIPLPFTGAWTGSAVAAVLQVKFKHALPAILLGNLVAGAAITLLTIFAGGFLL